MQEDNQNIKTIISLLQEVCNTASSNGASNDEILVGVIVVLNQITSLGFLSKFEKGKLLYSIISDLYRINSQAIDFYLLENSINNNEIKTLH